MPHVAQGMMIQYGRYISPPHIEAQLSPTNYLYTHSLMFTYDCYTQTGINAAIKLNDQWTVQFGVHAGDDIAPTSLGAPVSAGKVDCSDLAIVEASFLKQSGAPGQRRCCRPMA